MSRPVTRVTVWNENVHETTQPEIAAIYPSGIHGAIADGIRRILSDEVTVGTATLAEPEHGLSEQVLDETDVLFWWGHIAHDQVADEVVERVHRHVLAGMGLVVLHSGHFS
jgi:trehalose utilization protein